MGRRVPDFEARMQGRVFRPTDDEVRKPYALYRIFDTGGRLLYIGVTEDVEHRMYMHRQTTTQCGWLTIRTRYDRHTSTWFPTKADAREAERSAIASERPLLNRQHNPTRWRRREKKHVPQDAEALETLSFSELAAICGLIPAHLHEHWRVREVADYVTGPDETKVA